MAGGSGTYEFREELLGAIPSFNVTIARTWACAWATYWLALLPKALRTPGFLRNGAQLAGLPR